MTMEELKNDPNYKKYAVIIVILCLTGYIVPELLINKIVSWFFEPTSNFVIARSEEEFDEACEKNKKHETRAAVGTITTIITATCGIWLVVIEIVKALTKHYGYDDIQA